MNRALRQAATDLVITLGLVRGGRPVRSGAIQAVHGHRTDPMAKLLDEFEFAARPSLNRPLVLELLQGEDLDRRENNLLVEFYGTGATRLATALGMSACSQFPVCSASDVGNWIALLPGQRLGDCRDSAQVFLKERFRDVPLGHHS